MFKLFMIAAMVGKGANSGVSIQISTTDFKTELACNTAAKNIENNFQMRWATGEVSAWCIFDGVKP